MMMKGVEEKVLPSSTRSNSVTHFFVGSGPSIPPPPKSESKQASHTWRRHLDNLRSSSFHPFLSSSLEGRWTVGTEWEQRQKEKKKCFPPAEGKKRQEEGGGGSRCPCLPVLPFLFFWGGGGRKKFSFFLAFLLPVCVCVPFLPRGERRTSRVARYKEN